MTTDRIADPILGEGEIGFGTGEGAWATFEVDFPPTKSRVLVLASVVNGKVPKPQRDLYRELTAWYPKGAPEIFQAIRREVEKDAVLIKWLPPDDLPSQLRLTTLDIRYPFRPPAKAILEYKFDPNAPKWFVRIGEDFHVEWCGLGD